MNINDRIKAELYAMQDLKYKEFQCALMPTVNPDTVIGVRTPKLRAFAKALSKEETIGEFLECLPHQYYEENNIHGFIIEQINDYDKCIAEIDRFLTYVDNWATCDTMRPKCLKKHTETLIFEIKRWLSSERVYTVRFGIGMLMAHYLDELFKVEYHDLVASIISGEYYVNMMIAWYFATALAKQYELTLPYLAQKRLPIWVHNKTIQKAVESYRITDEQKTSLRGLRIKSK